ncbi:hypothetical protein [Pseudomonas sp. PSKL.D1]|uniref:hypothetical protein n=1 Tax=Pseudomonas sp. PSKL.D1 TaxID=3029060 RepID=UPI0023815B22|nr:hypothetical protein [Pseudomonas sp. PSKL.D1]WDY56370.1 hypothetical protein PVV54_17405 [Pseudomonas sp. PSKL.D1]
MTLLRCFAFSLCLAPFCMLGAAAHAAQPVGHDQAAHKAPVKPAKAKPARKPVSKAVTQPLPKAHLDLSLPVDMVKNLEPDVGSSATRRKPLLPAMFTEKPQTDDSPFQLNGRLISNEMQLQLRNDSRRDVEGAAIEFEFRQ